ncbi:Hpt domain-containing protein [Rhodobacter sp. NTK016B]|uniref:Hpt domain-containing protein n=1 Tax=Rhodobacter sp. NTK016B TaxID=2759676 RepID=UPI00257125EF|nr:Hpt domain-containing protein [Rhodobacter sp. NTK016B]
MVTAMIDWAQVDELRSDMGDAFGDVVKVFMQEVEEALATLSSEADAGTLKETLHFLKGAALNLGFSQFAATCATAEKDAAAGQVDGIDPDAIRALYAESEKEFRIGLAKRAA